MRNFPFNGYIITITLLKSIEPLDGASVLLDAGDSQAESSRGGGSQASRGGGSRASRPVPTDGRVCDYQCSESGGCQVKYVGPSRDGKVKGSCASRLFGGICRGTPPECLDCNKALHCAANISSQVAGSETTHTRNMCEYKCKSNGGCEATFLGSFRTGPYSGSCAPPSFGGKCLGIPPECGTSCHTTCSNSEAPSLQDENEAPSQLSKNEAPSQLDETSPAENEAASDLDSTSHTEDMCEYKCKSDGGCTAKYTGPHRSGPLLGSCAPPSFGGECLGIPDECESTCLTFCADDIPAIIGRLLY